MKLSCAVQGGQTTAPNSPGAVLVKEKFIELPKRVARNFHGKRQLNTIENISNEKSKENQTATVLMSSSNESIFKNGQSKLMVITKPRFTTTMVNEVPYEPATKENC